MPFEVCCSFSRGDISSSSDELPVYEAAPQKKTILKSPRKIKSTLMRTGKIFQKKIRIDYESQVACVTERAI
jgi:hypothetical protein